MVSDGAQGNLDVAIHDVNITADVGNGVDKYLCIHHTDHNSYNERPSDINDTNACRAEYH